jgi:hypothetical protein
MALDASDRQDGRVTGLTFIGDMRKAMNMVDVTATEMSNLNRDLEVNLTVAAGTFAFPSSMLLLESIRGYLK